MNLTASEINIVILGRDRENTLRLSAALDKSALPIRSIKKAATIKTLQKFCGANKPSVIMLDTGKEHDGDLFDAVHAVCPGVAIIVITEKKNAKWAYSLLEKGATDFFKKAGRYDPLLLEKSIRFSIEAKQTAESLRLSNERYALVSKATNDMVWDWDMLNNRVFRSADGWEKVFGNNANSESEHADSWWDRVHPDDRQMSNKILESVLHNPDTEYFEIECRMRRSDDTYATVVDRGYAIRNSEGEVTRLIGATEDITEKKAAEEKLAAERRIMHDEFTKAVITAQEQERGELGKELHDNINQILATTKLYIEYSLTNEDMRNDLLKSAKGLIESAVFEIRLLSKRLVPPSLGELGLITALKELADTVQPVNKFNIIKDWNGLDERGITEDLKLTVFRIVQEQLTNISRHADATEVTISLKRKEKLLSLLIKDNGKGFDPRKKVNGVGLKNILSRASLHHGKPEITAAAGKGCKLSVLFKLQQDEQLRLNR